MFNLTCPSCGNQTRVRFARMGATATCAECKHQYKVDGHTLQVIEDEQTPKPAAEEPASPFDAVVSAAESGQKKAKGPTAAEQKAAQKSAAPPRRQQPASPASDDIENIPVAVPAQQHVDEADMAAPVATPPGSRATPSDIDDELPIASPRTHLDPRMSPDPTETGAYRRGGLKQIHLILGGAAAVLVLIVVLFLTLSGGGEPEPTPGPVAQNGNGDTNTTPPPDPTPPDPTPATTPPDPTPPDTTPPDTTPIVVDPAADLPFLLLDQVSEVTYNWVTVDPPLDPNVSPRLGPDVLVSSVQLQRFPAGATMLVQHLVDSPQVNGSAFLHIQMLDATGKVYAELQSKVPVVCGKQGLQFRIPVPADVIERYDSHVASLVPVEPMADAVALEPVESRFRKVGTQPGAPEAVRIVVHNPSDKLLVSPVFAVDILNPQGYPIGTWQGGVGGSDYRIVIKPGQTLAFQIKLAQELNAQADRVRVRGYGTLGNATVLDLD